MPKGAALHGNERKRLSSTGARKSAIVCVAHLTNSASHSFMEFLERETLPTCNAMDSAAVVYTIVVDYW